MTCRFRRSEIDAVILTHAHLDHCGWIPRLVKEGFRGPIYATPPTIDLCGIILPDSGHLQEEDAALLQQDEEIEARSGAAALYVRRGAEFAAVFQAGSVGETVRLSAELSFRFVRAAHILGSCMAEIYAQYQRADAKRLLFTGDIGRVRDHKVAPGKVVHSGPAEGETADLLVMESTYGNRTASEGRSAAGIGGADYARPPSAAAAWSFRRLRLSARRNSSFILKHLMESGQIPRMPVFCDSPMAIKAVEIFLKHDEEYSDETRDMIRKYGSPLQWPGFTFASTPEESKKINDAQYAVQSSFLRAAW